MSYGRLVMSFEFYGKSWSRKCFSGVVGHFFAEIGQIFFEGVFFVWHSFEGFFSPVLIIYAHTNIHTHTHTDIRTHTNIHTHTHTDIRTHTNTHTDMH